MEEVSIDRFKLFAFAVLGSVDVSISMWKP